MAVLAFSSAGEGVRLNQGFVRIKDTKVRRKIIELVIALAEPLAAAGTVSELD